MAIASALLNSHFENLIDKAYLLSAVRDIVIVGTLCRAVNVKKFDPQFEINMDYQSLGLEPAAAEILAGVTVHNAAARDGLKKMLLARSIQSATSTVKT